jgi:hypothetical protein
MCALSRCFSTLSARRTVRASIDDGEFAAESRLPAQVAKPVAFLSSEPVPALWV